MDFPKTLYKYRDWKRESNKRNLTETEIYFASPNDFNDPFDCSIPFRYDEKDTTPENIFKKLVAMGQRLHPEWSEKKLHEYAYKAQQQDLLNNEHHLDKHNESRKDNFNKIFGVVSLTIEKNNFLMWSHYADSHSGYSIGYNSQKLSEQTQAQLGPVQYQTDFPKFSLFGDHKEYFIKYSYTKSEIWRYENEYRLLKDGSSRKVFKLSEDVIDEVILGNKMNQATKFHLIDLIIKKYPKASIFDCKLHKSKFELTLERVG